MGMGMGMGLGMGMDGMAYSGQLLVANIYLLGPLASRMCRSSV